MVTTGMKTSEFWLHLVLQIVLFLNTVQVWDYMPPKYTVLVQGILGFAYMLSRGVAKHGNDTSGNNNTTVN